MAEEEKIEGIWKKCFDKLLNESSSWIEARQTDFDVMTKTDS